MKYLYLIISIGILFSCNELEIERGSSELQTSSDQKSANDYLSINYDEKINLEKIDEFPFDYKISIDLSSIRKNINNQHDKVMSGCLIKTMIYDRYNNKLHTLEDYDVDFDFEFKSLGIQDWEVNGLPRKLSVYQKINSLHPDASDFRKIIANPDKMIAKIKVIAIRFEDGEVIKFESN